MQAALQGSYFIWQLSFVTPVYDSAPRVGGRLNGVRQYDKRADRKWQTTVVRYNNDPILIFLVRINSQIRIMFYR